MIFNTLPTCTLAMSDAIAVASTEQVLFFSGAGLMALLTLTILEIVLGIDNVVFIAILTNKLPKEKQTRIRNIGLILAMVMRLILLALAYLIVQLTTPLFTILDRDITGKSLLLIAGGLFLIAKATLELHHLIDHVEHGIAEVPDPEIKRGIKAKTAVVSVSSVLMQVLMLDLVFSLDSVITAVGMTTNYWIMSTAVVISIIVMLVFAGGIARFVNAHPTMKTLALGFLVMIGMLLVAEGIGQHFPRGYVYFAMVFAILVEIVNMKAGHRKVRKAAAIKDS
ncbi:MAG: TerC family protein [Phycisphaerales bacterium]|nr:TerC family protein [Phycisphaerales bacterium]